MSGLGCPIGESRSGPSGRGQRPTARPPASRSARLAHPPADPCADFASYACDPQAPLGRLARRNDLFAWRAPALLRFLDELAAGKQHDPSPGATAMREAYVRCKDPAKRARGLPELREDLASVSRARTLDDLSRLLGRLRGGGLSPLVWLEPAWDPRDAARLVVAELDLRGPHLPRAMYRDKHRFVAEQRLHWLRLAELTGAIAPGEVETAVRIDGWLAARRLDDPPSPPGDAKPAPAGDRRPTVPAEALAGRRFPWPAYLAGLALARPGPFLPARERSLDDIDGLADVPLADLQAYLRVMLAEDHSEFVSEAFLEEERRFHEEIEKGWSPSPLRLGAACLTLVARAFPDQLADAYLSDLAEPRFESVARDLFTALRAELAASVRSATWMDADTRKASLEKLGRVKLLFIGEVEAHRFYGLVLPDGSFLDARSRTLAWWSRARLDQIGAPLPEEPVSPTLMSPAIYFAEPNVVWVSPEIVRPPYLRAGAFDAATFGALGATLGHELVHSIQPSTRTLENGLRGQETWSAPALAAFKERVACFAHTLGPTSPGAAGEDDGRRYAEEGISDVTGVEVALSAMERAAQSHAEVTLQQWRRTFFVAYAQQLCTFEPSERSEIEATRDPHAPVRLRINATVANVPAFAHAFQCPASAPLAPPQRCAVW